MTPGTKIGGFEILGPLGEGGMGQVHRARDTRLGRDVAVKILPAAMLADADRSERLAREAKMLAALNHPNIAAIYSIETEGPVHALVLELVEGETLRTRIRRGPLTVNDARAIARQIIAALDAAHQCGIVHRDLKPENVMVGARGVVKVLDFGLAKAATQVAAIDAQTVSAGPTSPGSILGTVAYMSPEQARGLPVDRRTDIWAFGCVLYEMLSGRRAFAGSTVSDTIVATLEREPDWSALPRETPPGIRRLLTRTLQKDPHDRLRDIADAIPDLEDTVAPAAPSDGRRAAAWIPWSVAAMAVLAAAALGILASRPRSPEPILTSVLTPITRDAGQTTTPAISRDGRFLAYASDRAGGGTLDIWVQQVTGGNAIRLTDDEADDVAPDFSPDGSQVVFQSDRGGGGAYVVSALGGSPRLVARGARDPRFSPDGTQLAYWAGAWRGGAANTASGIYVVSLNGGEPRRLASGIRSARTPVWALDGKSLLFLGRSDNRVPVADSYDWFWVTLEGSSPVKVGLFADERFRVGDTSPSAWTSSGVLFSNETDLWSVPISQTDGRMTGSPRRLTVSAGAYRSPAIAADGRIVFASTQDVRVIERVPLSIQAIPPPPVRLYADFVENPGRPSETSDGSVIVYERQAPSGTEIWTKHLRSGAEQMVTRVERSALLSATIAPDGSRIAYTIPDSTGIGVVGGVGRGFVVETTRGVPRQVCETCLMFGFLSDSRRLLFTSERRIMVHDVAGGTSLEAIVSPDAGVSRPHASPDDRWLAFRSADKSYVTALTPGRPPARESWILIDEPVGTGRPAGWSLDSRTVYLVFDTDGFRCLWGQRLTASGGLDGVPVPVRHFHGSDWTQLSTSFGNTITRDGFLYATIRRRGNIWSLVRRPQ
jgi:Tol biopolymer transport system component